MLLRLQNFYDHPIHKQYTVYQFYRKDMSDFFEGELIKSGVAYEKDVEKSMHTKFLFGVHKQFASKTREINNITLAKFRKPFIAHNGFKWFLLIFTLLVVIIAIIGGIKNA